MIRSGVSRFGARAGGFERLVQNGPRKMTFGLERGPCLLQTGLKKIELLAVG